MGRTQNHFGEQNMKTILKLFLLTCLLAADYPIVAIRAPRRGDEIINWPEVVHPLNVEPGTHLVLLKEGTEEVLVSAGEAGAILDPCPSLDGKWVYYSLVSDAKNTSGNYAHGAKIPLSGADIYKVNVSTKEIKKLTNQEFHPAAGVVWSKNPRKSDPPGTHYSGRGVFNTGACPVPGGRVVFTSDRDNIIAPKGGWSFPALQLYVMDDDGKNVEKVGHLNVASALHPTLMKNGMVAWSSWESQGYRDPRTWGLWASNPDGSGWEPLVSAFAWSEAYHFHAVRSDGEIVTTLYYNQNNNGLGTLLGFFMFPPDSLIPTPRFGNPDPAHPSNPTIKLAYANTMWPFKWGFSPYGLRAITPSSHHSDIPANFDPAFPGNDAKRLGKYTHPSGAPANELLAIYSPGPATDNVQPHTPAYNGWIVRLRPGVISNPSEHVVIKSDPNYNYQQPKALVPITDIYGTVPELPFVPNDGSKHRLLPEGTPFGLVGTSSFYKRDSAPVNLQGVGNSNWFAQGSDSGTYSNSEIHAVRIVQTEPQTNLNPIYKDGQNVTQNRKWTNHVNERLRNLGEIVLRKPGVVDADGNPDTSFFARIPANVPFSFQTLDRDGLVLNMAQTWHQVREGEIRNNCGGCHAHSQVGTDFSLTAAAKPDYVIQTLTQARDVEFDRDIWPILEAKCVSCHNDTHPSLVMTTADKAYANLVPPDYRTLGRVNGMRPRESKFLWKLHGRSLDGSGVAIQGARMPLNGDPLSNAELRTIGEWIGLGAARGTGVFSDDLRPTLTVVHPLRNESAKLIKVGAVDSGSGIRPNSLKLTLNDSDITSQFVVNDHIWTATVENEVQSGELIAEVSDNAGNLTRVVRTFNANAPPPPDNCQEQLAAAHARIKVLEASGLIKDSEIAKLRAALEKIEADSKQALGGN
jgi:hypothetical protein